MKKHRTEYLLKKHLTAPEQDVKACPCEFVCAKTGRVRIYLKTACGSGKCEKARSCRDDGRLSCKDTPSLSDVPEKKHYAGQFYIDKWSRDNTAYFRAFSISPRLRGCGLGTMLFPHILDYLYDSGFSNIVLQVSDSNPAALTIYKNNGFEIIESVIV